MSGMRIIGWGELSARPGVVLDRLGREGAAVVTRGGAPVGILVPTGPETLLEDMEEIVFARARRAVAAIRVAAGRNKSATLGPAEIEAEIRRARRGASQKG